MNSANLCVGATYFIAEADLSGVFIGAILVFAIAMLAVAGVLPSGPVKRKPDNIAALRALLLARAAGQLTQEEFERKQAALHAQILDQPEGPAPLPYRLPAMCALAVVTVAGLVWYGQSGPSSGSPGVMGRDNLSHSTPATPGRIPITGDQPANSGGDMATVTKRLEAKLEKSPDNGDGWLLLARSYRELGRLPDAQRAFAKAAPLLPSNVDLLTEWADTAYQQNGRIWQGDPVAILHRAMALDPHNLKILEIAGNEAFDRKDYTGALKYWTEGQRNATPDSMEAKRIAGHIRDAEAAQRAEQPTNR